PSVHIKDLLDLVDRNNPGLILKFGGHAMAAGLSIKSEEFYSFKRAFHDAIKTHLNDEIPKVELLTDGKLEAFDISLKNAEILKTAGPWGQGFEEPIFFGNFEIVDQKVVGEKHLKCRLKLVGDTQVHDAIAFFQAPLESTSVEVAYKLSINIWRGNTSLQLMVEQINPLL
ncbi:MAG: single-stranded-DNA-specific exonuclease RecJ, partial [Candidatus Ruthia sp.]|nr:single-stranded-DNA-specific exonuclease RecJ [Candidatus Ruthturnera sp.]